MTKTEGAMIACAGFLAIAVLLEVFTLITKVLSAAQGSDNGIPPYFVQASIAQTQFHDSLSVASPALMLMMLFSWVPLLPFWGRRQTVEFVLSTHPRRKETRSEMISSLSLLGIAMIVGTFAAVSPYFTHRGLLGIDTPSYYRQLESLKTFEDVASLLRTDWHPLYILVLYFIKIITAWDSFQVIVAGPALLAALFAVANFLLAGELTKSHIASGIASLFAVSWLHTTVGLFAGIFANWLAIGFAVLSVFSLFRTLRERNRLSAFGALSFAYLTALSHIWTWTVLIACYWLGSALFLLGHSRKSEMLPDREVLGRLAVILVAITLPVVVLSLILPELNGLLFSPGVTVYGIAGSMRFERIYQVWVLMSFTLTQYVGGLLGYPLAIVLGLAGIIFMAKSGLTASPFLMGWLFVTSITTLMLDSWYQWRVLYVIPFEIFAAIAIAGILATLGRISKANRPTIVPSVLLTDSLQILFVILIVLDSLNYATRAAASLPQ
jgi:hypothetical protein